MIFCSELKSDFYGFKMRRRTITSKTDPKDVRVHTHNYIEIIYVIKGSGVHEIDGVCYSVGEDDVIIVNIGQTHKLSTDSVMDMYYVCFFPASVSPELDYSRDFYDILTLPDFSDAQKCFACKHSVITLGTKSAHLVKELMAQMYREYINPGADVHVVLKSSINIILNVVFREMTDKRIHFKRSELTRESVTEYVDRYCKSRLTLTEMAEWFNCNSSYFSRRFKELTGVTFAKYVRSVKINTAAKLLKEGRVTVDEVCRMVGFTDKTAFYKEFKKCYGVTPAEYKKEKTESDG
ncbi:MAG: helix-turn-helix domain-containing protein [Clostridia bacterium]|nr:helix-turn-helix domain-containing protein [Clostridia bacterium]